MRKNKAQQVMSFSTCRRLKLLQWQYCYCLTMIMLVLHLIAESTLKTKTWSRKFEFYFYWKVKNVDCLFTDYLVQFSIIVILVLYSVLSVIVTSLHKQPYVILQMDVTQTWAVTVMMGLRCVQFVWANYLRRKLQALNLVTISSVSYACSPGHK